MKEPHTSETDDFLAALDDLDVADAINTAFVIEVDFAHRIEKTKEEKAPSPLPRSDSVSQD